MRKDYIKEDRLTNNTHIRTGSFSGDTWPCSWLRVTDLGD